MAAIWAISIIKTTGSLVSSILVEEIIKKYLLARINSEYLQRKINDVVTQTFSDTLNDYPSFQEEIDSKIFIDFLNQPIVVQELAKIIHPIDSPDLTVLTEEWEKLAGKPLQGNNRLVIETFINRVKKQIWDIPELSEILHIKESHETHILIETKLPEIESNVRDLLSIKDRDETKKVYSEEEKKYDAKLDVCRDLLHRNHPNAALSLLSEIEKEFSQIPGSNYLRFRLNTLVGGCYLELRLEKEAIQRFKRALTLAPENTNALANAALSAFLENRIDQAIELAQKSLQLGGADTVAPAVLIISYAIQHKYKDLDTLIDDNFFNNINYVRALGSIYYQAKNLDKAGEYYRLCLAQEPNDFYANLILSQLILETQLAKNKLLPLSTIGKDSNWKNAFSTAMDLVNTALGIAHHGDNENYIKQALITRSALFFINDDLLHAKIDCETIIQQFPNNVDALHNLGILALLDKDYKHALELFYQLPQEYQTKEEVIFAIVKAQTSIGELDKASQLLNEFIKTSGSEGDYRIRVCKAEISIQRGNLNEANMILDELLADKPSIEGLIAASIISDLLPDVSKTSQILLSAYNLASENKIQREVIIIRLATQYYSATNFADAIIWFEKLDLSFLDDKALTRAYIQCLYSVRRYGDAYKICQQVRENGRVDPYLIEIESWLAEYLGDLETALKLEYLLSDIEKGKLSHQLQISRLEFRTGNHQKAIDILDSINVNSMKDPNNLIQVAEIYSFMDRPDIAIKLAYQARCLGLNSPEIHLAYSTLFIRVDEDLEDLNLDHIVPNSAVYISGESSRWIKLLSVTPPNENSWEFSPDSELGKLLIGKKVGDIVTFKSGPLENLQYTIREIQSIYVRAFQETMDEFGTRFPEHPGLHKMTIVDKDFTKFFTFIFQQSAFAEEVYKAYEKGIISVEQFAFLIGRNIIDVFTSLQGLLDQRVFASYGSVEDQTKQSITIESLNAVTLDLTGLLTIAYLELLPALVNRFQVIYIAQRLIDEIDKTIADRFFELKKGRRTIGFHEGHPFFEEFSPDVVERNIQYLQALLDFCKNKCKIIPIPPELAVFLEPQGDPKQYIGRESIAAILVAKYTNTPLLADDARLRIYAEQNHQVSGFWSQILVSDMESKGIIDHITYVNSTVKLLETRYFFTAINEKLILDVLDQTNYTSDHRLRAVLTGLHGPEASEDRVLPIVSNLLVNVWLSAITNEQRMFILDQVLAALCHGRNRQKVILRLTRIVRSQLMMAPRQQQDLLNQIMLWYQVMSANLPNDTK